MDIDDFDHINGTYGDVEYAKAWGSPEAIARAESQAQQVKAAKLRAARELMRVYEEEEFADVKKELADVKKELVDVKKELVDVKKELVDVKKEQERARTDTGA